MIEKKAISLDNKIGQKIANNENTSTLVLGQLVTTQYHKKQHADFYYTIVNHPNISPKVLDLIVIHCQYYSVRRFILEQPITSVTTLERFIFFKDFISDRSNYELLIEHPNSTANIIKLADFIISHQDIPKGILQELSQYVPQTLGNSIFQRPNRASTQLDEIIDQIPKTILDNPLLNLLLIQNPESRFIQLALAKDSNTSAKLFAKLAESNNQEILNTLATNPDIPPIILEQLANYSDDYLGYLVAKNSHASDETLNKLSQKNNRSISEEVARNPNTSQETIDRLTKSKSPMVRAAIAKNPKISSSTALLLTKDASRHVRQHLAMNPNIAIEIIEILAQDKSSYVHVGVAKNSNTPSTILEILVASTNNKVRRAVAENLQTPLTVLERLKKDRDKFVRAKLAKNASISLAIMEYLVNDKVALVRQSIAENLQTPATILDKLKSDRSQNVLQYLIKNSNTSLDTLNQLLSHKNVRIAIAAKKSLEQRMQ